MPIIALPPGGGREDDEEEILFKAKAVKVVDAERMYYVTNKSRTCLHLCSIPPSLVLFVFRERTKNVTEAPEASHAELAHELTMLRVDDLNHQSVLTSNTPPRDSAIII